MSHDGAFPLLFVLRVSSLYFASSQNSFGHRLSQKGMYLFKNSSETWLPMATVGPFPEVLKMKNRRRKPKEDVLRVVECQASDVLNIPTSAVIRFEPRNLVFTSDNISLASTSTMNVFLHASYPVNLTFPIPRCQIWNRTTEEHARIASLQTPSDELNNDDGDEWKLVSHFGPLTSKYRPRVNRTNVFSCKSTRKGLKVHPNKFVWDPSNYTKIAFVPHYVHSSYPDDQVIPPPKCTFRRDVLPTTESLEGKSAGVYISIAGITFLLLAMAFLSYLYWFSNKNENSLKEASPSKSMPLTFSQKLAQRGLQGIRPATTNEDGWTIVEGPGTTNLAIQFLTNDSYVTKLVPKIDQAKETGSKVPNGQIQATSTRK